jgi:hypothetical protein
LILTKEYPCLAESEWKKEYRLLSPAIEFKKSLEGSWIDTDSVTDMSVFMQRHNAAGFMYFTESVPNTPLGPPYN